MKQNVDFGFGCMRMPTREGSQMSFDYDRIEELFDLFLEQGFSYFDTAYTYHGYQAEQAVGKALVKRHPRESFQLATKLPLRDFKDAEDMERIFAEQLTSCGVEYFDYYLLHNMGANVYEKCKKYDVFRFVQRKKQEGRIRYVGMSFHDRPQLLKEILETYSDGIDFLQLQVNYMDWEQPNIQARRCVDIANYFQKPITVMEPCKGGTLANVPKEAEELMRTYAPDRSIASWAFRYAASVPGVNRVLSGMNAKEQVIDNIKNFAEFEPLTNGEKEVICKVVEIISTHTVVPCTACGYCTHDCPRQIPIPEYFALLNNMEQTTGSFSSQAVYYMNTSIGRGKASDCIKCGNCEKACPQHIEIRKKLEQVVDRFEKTIAFR